MTRDITNAVETEVQAQVVQPFLLAELMFDGDPIYAWNGVGTLTWNGNDYTGVGDLGGIDPIGETTNIQARGIAFSLSGVPSATISLALGSNYSGRIARLRLGFFDGNGVDTANIIADPFVIAEGFMDQLDIEEQGETSKVTVKAESRLITLQRAREFLYDHEDQQAIYPGDKGFEFVAALQNKEISWGVGTGRANAPRRIRPSPGGAGSDGNFGRGGPQGTPPPGGFGRGGPQDAGSDAGRGTGPSR